MVTASSRYSCNIQHEGCFSDPIGATCPSKTPNASFHQDHRQEASYSKSELPIKQHNGRLAWPFLNTLSKTKPQMKPQKPKGPISRSCFDSPFPQKNSKGSFRDVHTLKPVSVKLFLRSFLDLTSIVFLWQALVRSRVERCDALLNCSLRRIRGDRLPLWVECGSLAHSFINGKPTFPNQTLPRR